MKSSNKNKHSRKGASYISKPDTTKNSSEVEDSLNFELTKPNKKYNFIFWCLGLILTPVIGTLMYDGSKNLILNYMERNPQLILKSYAYERETPKYKVYSIIFTINNIGNHQVSLQQAIPYDASSSINFLQNNSCESYTDITVEKDQSEDFNMHVFMPKDYIGLAKNLEKDSKYSTIINSNGEVQNANSIHSQIEVVAKVFIYNVDKKMNTSMTFKLPYKNGDELNAESIGETAEFKVTNDSLYKCPIKNSINLN